MKKEDNEFQEIGRRTSYKVPDHFFEQVSQKTLQKAKEREKRIGKKIMLFRTLAVAASIAALVFVSYFVFQPQNTETKKMTYTIQTVPKDTTIKEKVAGKDVVASQQIAETKPRKKSEEPVKETPEIKIEPAVKTSPDQSKAGNQIQPEEKAPEDIGNVLSDLSDDELLQLAAMYKSDPFIDESQL